MFSGILGGHIPDPFHHHGFGVSKTAVKGRCNLPRMTSEGASLLAFFFLTATHFKRNSRKHTYYVRLVVPPKNQWFVSGVTVFYPYKWPDNK